MYDSHHFNKQRNKNSIVMTPFQLKSGRGGRLGEWAEGKSERFGGGGNAAAARSAGLAVGG